MRELNAVLAALQAEVAASLGRGVELPDGAKLAANRVTLSLAFALEEMRGGNGSGAVHFVVPVGKEKSAAPHSLTVEFQITNGQLVPGNAPAATATAATTPALTTAGTRARAGAIPETDFGHLVQLLSGVFGAPGFDSSARATVFREALEELTEEQSRTLIASLSNGVTLSEPALKRAQHLLKRTLQSGPGGLAASAAAVQTLFEQYPVGALVKFVEARWKTQADWMK